MAVISVVNGPNLNLLGVREPNIYGTETLEDIHAKLSKLAGEGNHALFFHQSNAEHAIIELIHQAFTSSVDCIIINPGAYTHTSIAIRDAFLATKLPFIEVHLSNIHSREAFRKHSYLSDIARGLICGFGSFGYELAFQAALQQCGKQ